jgi:hypothetical protein
MTEEVPCAYSAASSTADFTWALATGDTYHRPHGAQRYRHALHRALHERRVADQRGIEALGREQPGQQSHGRARIAHVERMRRRVQALEPDACDLERGLVGTLDRYAQRAHCLQRRNAILAREEARDARAPLGDTGQHQ